jgi:DNA-binding PadR family transcriptional regulator
MDKLQELRNMMPLTETSLYILIALAEPLHGYGIMQKVEGLSRKRIVFGPGTLYGALSNLNALGLIAPHGEQPSSSRKKEYRITELGLALVKLELERLKELIHHAETLVYGISMDKE